MIVLESSLLSAALVLLIAELLSVVAVLFCAVELVLDTESDDEELEIEMGEAIFSIGFRVTLGVVFGGGGVRDVRDGCAVVSVLVDELVVGGVGEVDGGVIEFGIGSLRAAGSGAGGV